MSLQRIFGGLTTRPRRTGHGVLDALLPLLTRAGGIGGLAGLASHFTNAGFGDQVKSWIGNGANRPIEGNDVEKALGSATVNDIAAKAGVSPEEAKASVATLLPEVVDRLTPNGSVPTGGLGRAIHGLDLTSILGAGAQPGK